MNKQNWAKIRTPLYRWNQSLERIICSYNIPDLTGPAIYIGSDYSGSHRDSRYHVISVFYVDLRESLLWHTLRHQVRRQYLPDGRRMSFKGLNDRKKQEALIPFLNAANHAHGICLTIAVNKDVTDLCLYKQELTIAQNSFGLETKWTHKSLEIAMRISCIVAMLVCGLSKPKQDVCWISDEDELFSNAGKMADMGKLFSKYTAININHELGLLGVGTNIIDEDDRLEEDLTAIPDLIAGTMAEVTTKLAQSANGRIPGNLALSAPRNLTMKTNLISSWLWQKQSPLQKVVAVVEQYGNEATMVFRLDMDEVSFLG